MSFYPAPNPPGLGPPSYPYSVPPRILRLDNEENAPPYCTAQLVKALLAPYWKSLVSFYDGPAAACGDGSGGDMPSTLCDVLIPLWIGATTDYIVKELRTPYDWCYRILFLDGPGANTIVLPDRNIRDVLAVYLRVLPSNVWYKFAKMRKVDGSEFFGIGGIVEQPIAPEALPVLDPVTIAETQPAYITPTGIEDADLLVDTRRRTIKIPPRVLYAGVNVPLWNYTFNAGALNVEIHYTFGFPPTKYTDGSPLQYATGGTTPTSNMVITPKTGFPNVLVDYSSGMPTTIIYAVAQVAANMARRAFFEAQSQGISSISVDGASESFGGSAFGGALDEQDKQLLDRVISKYAIQMVL